MKMMLHAGRPFAAACLSIALAGASLPVSSQPADPLTVFRAFGRAESAGAVEQALSYFADDAVLVNTRGKKYVGRANIRKFIVETTRGKAKVTVASSRVHGDTVTVIDHASTEFYEKLGIAPVENIHDVTVRRGKIISFINHLSVASVAKLQAACHTATAQGLPMFGQSCTEFATQAAAQTKAAEQKLGRPA